MQSDSHAQVGFQGQGGRQSLAVRLVGDSLACGPASHEQLVPQAAEGAGPTVRCVPPAEQRRPAMWQGVPCEDERQAADRWLLEEDPQHGGQDARPERGSGRVEALHDRAGFPRQARITSLIRTGRTYLGAVPASEAVDLRRHDAEVVNGIRVVEHAPLDAVELPRRDFGQLQPSRQSGEQFAGAPHGVEVKSA
jgi:hypothetical protein